MDKEVVLTVNFVINKNRHILKLKFKKKKKKKNEPITLPTVI